MRRSGRIVVLSLALLGAGSALPAQDVPARGLAFWTLVPAASIQELATSTAGAPRFAVGIQRATFRLGIGVGYLTVRSTDHQEYAGGGGSDDRTTATLMQIGPTAIVDVWRSPDSRTCGNVSGGASIGRVRTSSHSSDTFGYSSDSKARGTVVSYHVALGADHFLSPHFAIGAEAGFARSHLSDLKDTVDPTDKTGFGAGGTYTALRVTLVF